tara:strand:+ start:590 stop:886 length:297 start_codon:yes stop_codon:yes gene_type:complete
MDFNFEEFEREFNERYQKRKVPPEELRQKWKENSQSLREHLMDEEFVKEVQDAEISELEINILHSALLSIIPDMQTQIDFLRERLENVEAYLRGNAQE